MGRSLFQCLAQTRVTERTGRVLGPEPRAAGRRGAVWGIASLTEIDSAACSASSTYHGFSITYTVVLEEKK